MTHFVTDDIILAAVLKYKHYVIIDMQMKGNKGTFVFENVPDSVIHEYDLGQTLVEPLEFTNFVKQLTTATKRKAHSVRLQPEM